MRIVLVALAAASLAAPAFAADIINGNFEAGNVGFTSAYTYIPDVANGNTAAAQYTIGTNAYPWNTNFASYGDNTTGTGNYMIVNGAAAAETVWQNLTPVLLTQGHYSFHFALSDACCNSGFNNGVDPAPPLLQINLNGIQVGSNGLTVSPPAGAWHTVSQDFVVTSATTLATFRIINNRPDAGGNDFGLDDIHVSAIPEPATWALMLGGLFSLGAGLRANRRRTSAVVA